MWEIHALQAIGVLLAVGFAAAVAAVGYKHWRMKAAGEAPMDGSACIACASTEVSEFDSDCFRCDRCEFVWGDGLHAHRRKQREAQIAGLDDSERRAFAVRELGEADARLLAADAFLDNASGQLGLDMVAGGGWYAPGDSDPYSRVRSAQMVKAAAEMQRAHQHMEAAAAAVASAQLGSAGPGEPSAGLMFADMLASTALVDLFAHKQVGDMKE